MERLQKIIANAGLASRRHAEALILAGQVSVNGTVVTTLGAKADPHTDSIRVDGKRVNPVAEKCYILLNKPKGYVTTRSDPQGRPTVMDLVKEVQATVYPVGRLDFDSEGLLILTNDGDLAAALMHPSSEVEKTYWLKISGIPTDAQLERVARGGISIPGARTAPCKIRILRTSQEYAHVEVILHEGKNREIRHVMQKIGHPVNKLKRIGYAFLKLGDMPLGGIRHITQREVDRLWRCVKSDRLPPPLPSPKTAPVKLKVKPDVRPSRKKPRSDKPRWPTQDSRDSSPAARPENLPTSGRRPARKLNPASRSTPRAR
jgi:pseudouridine synthase